MLSSNDLDTLLQAGRPARRASGLRRARASRHRPVRSATASAWRSAWPTPTGSRATTAAIYVRARRRRDAGGLDLGSDDDGRQSAAQQSDRLRRPQRFPGARAHERSPSGLLSGAGEGARLRLGSGRGERPRSAGDLSTRSPIAARTGRCSSSAARSRARASPTWRTCRSGTTARRTRRNTSRRSTRSPRSRHEKQFRRHLLRSSARATRACASSSPTFRRPASIAKFRNEFPGSLHQHRRCRADHDRHGRRHGAARPAAVRLHDRDLHALSVRSKWCATISATRTCR